MIELAAVEAARERIAGTAVRTPLVRLHVEDAPAEISARIESSSSSASVGVYIRGK